MMICLNAKDNDYAEVMSVDMFYEITFYEIICSLTVFLCGLMVPRERVNTEKRLFKSYKWEHKGKVYDKLKINKWKDKVPDMSKFVKSMPKKKLNKLTPDAVRGLINETCIAEVSHIVLVFLSFGINQICDGLLGFVCFVLYGLLGNVPYIIIQRYNRPRLIKLLNQMERKNANFNTDL